MEREDRKIGGRGEDGEGRYNWSDEVEGCRGKIEYLNL